MGLLKKIAIYPGTFDPITNGHLDIVKRALKLFDKLVIAIANNSVKNPKFSVKNRIEMIEACTKNLSNIEILSFDSLLIDFVKGQDARIIIRGIRAVSDFEYELQMFYANATLSSDIETVFLMPSSKNAFISSSIVRSILNYGFNVENMVPKEVLALLKKGF